MSDDINYPTQYALLLRALLLSPDREVNRRTGAAISLIPSGHTLTIRSGPSLPLIGLRRTYPRTAAAEVEWFVSGERNLRMLHRFGVHIWDQFAESNLSCDDWLKARGASKLEVSSAYGYRWRRHFGRDQLREAVETLREDPTSRRAAVFAWDPALEDMRRSQLAVPCPVGFSLFSSMPRGGSARELHSTLWIRSSDVFVGLPYDVMGHAMLMGLIASELGMRPGWLSVSLAYPHLYDVHRGMAQEALGVGHGELPWVRIADVSLSEVEEGPGILVSAYGKAQGLTNWPSFDPRPKVVK